MYKAPKEPQVYKVLKGLLAHKAHKEFRVHKVIKEDKAFKEQ